MKKNILGLSLFLVSAFAFAQSGLDSIIVEKYYVANTADVAAANTDAVGAGYATGALPVGSVTYRIYADLLLGYNLQAIYGVTGHELKVTTTTSFYNNSAGSTTASSSRNSVKNTTGNVLGLDSYLAMGAAASNAYGILKSDDDVTLGGANLITSVSGNVLQNNATLAGIPLTTQDGYYYSGTPTGLVAPSAASFTPGLDVTMFNDGSTIGNSFITSNGSVYVAGGVTGPVPATNRVLIGQFTTNGDFCYELNLQIGTPTPGVFQNFVALAPTGSEIQNATLKGCILSQSTGVSVMDNKNSAVSSFTFYPNPATDMLNIEINAASKESVANYYSIYNVAGVEMLHKNLGVVSKNQIENIDISSLSKGLYFIKLSVDGSVSTKKLIKN